MFIFSENVVVRLHPSSSQSEQERFQKIMGMKSRYDKLQAQDLEMLISANAVIAPNREKIYDDEHMAYGCESMLKKAGFEKVIYTDPLHKPSGSGQTRGSKKHYWKRPSSGKLKERFL